MAITRIKSSNIEDGTVANVDIADLDSTKLTGTIATARLSNVDLTTLSASNLTTGTIPDARIPASAVTQHVTATDLTAVHQAIATLGLHTAVSDNKAAFNLPNAFIDTFEDDSGIATETTVDRVTADEYVASVYTSIGTQAQVAQGTGTVIGTHTYGGGNAAAFDGTTSQHSTSGAKANVTATSWLGKDWGVGVTKTVSGFKCWSSNNDGLASSGQAGSGCSITLFGNSTNNTGTAVDLGGLTNLNFRQNNHVADYTKLSGLTTSTAYRYHWVKFDTGAASLSDINCSELQFFEDPTTTTTNATGTLISDTQTAPSATTEASGVILYKDNGSSSTVLGTHLKIYFTADNGSNWTEAASYGTAQTFSGTTKQVKLGKTTGLTSGTQVAMKAVWAGQASTTMETQLHGWAVNY